MSKTHRLMEWTPERVARFCDWQSKFPEQYFNDLFGLEIIVHLAPYVRGKKVLNLGCGIGGLIPHLCALAESVTGADASPDSIAKANALYESLAQFRGAKTLEEIRTCGEKFDVVLSVEVVEHLDDVTLGAMFSLVRKLLLPEGLLVVTTPNEEDLERGYLYCPEADVAYPRWQHIRSWSADSLSQYLGKNGFSCSQAYATDLAAQGFSRRALFRRLKKGLAALRGHPVPPPHLICVSTLSRMPD